MIVECIASGLLGALVGICMVRDVPTEPEPLDAALEAYRDAAASFCEALLAGFGSTTQWDKWRQAREVYLVESQGENEL